MLPKCASPKAATERTIADVDGAVVFVAAAAAVISVAADAVAFVAVCYDCVLSSLLC